jgi:hypothetical protein
LQAVTLKGWTVTGLLGILNGKNKLRFGSFGPMWQRRSVGLTYETSNTSAGILLFSISILIFRVHIPNLFT